jgi:S-(hydroxymethyl)glutathione dehydrogenase/alcohol dehydrogenase
MKITAVVLTRAGFPLEIKRLITPKLLPGQVLVKILFSGVCRSQLMEVQGCRGKDKWLPHMFGHEVFGKVVDIGAGVSKGGQGW